MKISFRILKNNFKSKVNLCLISVVRNLQMIYKNSLKIFCFYINEYIDQTLDLFMLMNFLFYIEDNELSIFLNIIFDFLLF